MTRPGRGYESGDTRASELPPPRTGVMTRRPPDGEVLLRTSEVARAIGAAQRTVLMWLGRGRFRGAIRTPGGQWRVPQSAVDRVLAEILQPNTDSEYGR